MSDTTTNRVDRGIAAIVGAAKVTVRTDDAERTSKRSACACKSSI